MDESAAITIAPEPIGSADARFALEQYVAELNSLFPAGFDTARAAPPETGDFTEPAGVFLVVRCGGRVAGCGAVRTEANQVGEIRRMWIDPVLRGRGAGRRLLGELEAHARRLGCTRVRLDTAAELGTARALYISSGYVEIDAYNDNRYAKHWFEKDLTR